MAAVSDSQVTAAPLLGARYHSPRAFTSTSPQIGETQTTATPGAGSGGNAGTGGVVSSDAAQALKFAATCAATDLVGNAVRMNGAANAVTTVTSTQPYPCVGIITAKASATSCTVQTYGLVTGAAGGLTALQRYFVGADGKLATSGQAFAAGQFIQIVGFAVTADTIFVKPDGFIAQLAATQNANGDNTTPAPSGDGQGLLYGGVLYGTTPPAADYGHKSDSYFEYTSDGGVTLWGPKSDAGWDTSRSLRGLAGNRIYIRETPPDGSVDPNPGDCWIDKVAYNLYPAE